ncbi:MAG TPA: ROK family protein [Rhizomicrobium sp.]|jgi:fructokinase|nr:ROK family protein [Rhizomicrobium sp.]
MRIGVDLGGTKIEILALAPDGSELLRARVPTPRHSYEAVVSAIRDLVLDTEAKIGTPGSVGLAIPGIVSPKTGLVKNANSTVLIGHALDKDLAVSLNRPIRAANDANCFTLSEATDGAVAGREIVFGIIAGTGVGGGICVGGKLLTGAHAIAGEWGHNPLPSPSHDEIPGPACYCGKRGCIESWCSGPALSAQFEAKTGQRLQPTAIAAAALAGDSAAAAMMDVYLDRLARAIATLVNILDPHAIVMGGGLSNIDAFYTDLPKRVERYGFNPEGETVIVKNRHGDSSGVRGAAWLWRPEETDSGLPK